MSPALQSIALAVFSLTLASCTSPSWVSGPDEKVVYAFGPAEGFTSPLQSPMTPACPALKFGRGDLEAGPQHERVLGKLAEEGKAASGVRFVIAAYCHPDLPPEYARVLSEKRAHSVRQRLVELGVSSDAVQTAGYGNDFSLNAPAGDVVVVYKTTQQP